MRLVLVLWLSLVCFACGGPTEPPPQTVQSGKAEKIEHTISSIAAKTIYKQACEALGGDWALLGNFDLASDVTAHSGTHICNLPAFGANKVCDVDVRCGGRCINPDPETGKGYCSSGWLVNKSDFIISKTSPEKKAPGPPLYPDNLFAEKIQRIKDYVIRCHLWENRPFKDYSYVYEFDGGIVESTNPLPARLTIKGERIISTQYLGVDRGENDHNPNISKGKAYNWQGTNPLSYHYSTFTSLISNSMINDQLDIKYDPSFGHPVFIEADSAIMSDNYVRIEISEFQTAD